MTDETRIRDLEYAVKHLENYRAYLEVWRPDVVVQFERRLLILGIADRVNRAIRDIPVALPLAALISAATEGKDGQCDAACADLIPLGSTERPSGVLPASDRAEEIKKIIDDALK